MRNIKEIIVHCSSTPEGRNDTVEDIRYCHVHENGWSDIGYHFVIHLDGSVHQGRPIEKVGAHCSGHNAQSIGVCYVGGRTRDLKHAKDTRTAAQKAALKALVASLRQRFPGATVHGHDEFANKDCPCFNVKAEAL